MPRLAIQDQKSSLEFKGNSVIQHIVPSDTSILKVGDTSDFTVGAWVKLTPKKIAGNADSHTIAAADFNYAGDKGYLFQIGGADGRVISYVGNTSYYTDYGVFLYGTWQFVTFTMSGTTLKRYVNGELVHTVTTKDRVGNANGTTIYFGTEAGGTGSSERRIYGFAKKFFAVKEALTAEQIKAVMNGDSVASGVQYELDEGAGTVAYDSSGNNNNGTITNGTWVSDTPTKKRQVVGGNLVYNGDFEYAPPTNVNQTLAGTWIDGSAAGSSTNKLFGWVVNTHGTNGYCIITNAEKYSGSYSLRINNGTSGTTSGIYSSIASAAGIPTNYVLQPNTSYTLTARVKVDVVSGSGGTVKVMVSERTGAGGIVVDDAITIGTTTGWTLYTLAFTTSATTRFGLIKIEVAGTHVADAYIDDITLTPTTPDTRLAVVDRKSSLFLNGTTTNVAVPYTLPATGTISVWVNPSKLYDYVSMWSTSGASDKWECWLYYNGRIAARTGASALIGDGIIPNAKNSWYHVCQTWVSGGVSKLFINGAVFGSTQSTVNAYSGTTFYWGGDGTLNSLGCGNMSDGRIYTTALSDREVLKLYKTGISSVAPAVWNKLDEGAGTTAYDSSGNGNNGTITAGTFVLDTPTKKRKTVGGNLVYNGDFSIAPVVNVPMTGDYAWINGTSTGTTAQGYPIFGWFKYSYGGTQSAMIDTSELLNGKPSLKLSTLVANSYVGMAINSLDAGYHKWNNIPCLPNTSYTASVWVKTNLVSGTANSGARITISQLTGTGINSAGSGLALLTSLVTTTGWTKYEGTFTTSATARFLVPELRLLGQDGAATLIMDAWFADIQLRPTAPEARTVA